MNRRGFLGSLSGALAAFGIGVSAKAKPLTPKITDVEAVSIGAVDGWGQYVTATAGEDICVGELVCYDRSGRLVKANGTDSLTGVAYDTIPARKQGRVLVCGVTPLTTG